MIFKEARVDGGNETGERGRKGRQRGFYLSSWAAVRNMNFRVLFCAGGPAGPGSQAECLAQVKSTQAFPLSPSRSAFLTLEVGATEAKQAESWGVGTAVSSEVTFLIPMMWE